MWDCWNARKLDNVGKGLNSDALLNSEENPRPEDEKKNHSQDSIFAGSSRPLSLWKRSRYKYLKKYSLSWLYHKRFSHFNHICKRKRQPNSVELFSEHIHLLFLNYYIHFKLFWRWYIDRKLSWSNYIFVREEAKLEESIALAEAKQYLHTLYSDFPKANFSWL